MNILIIEDDDVVRNTLIDMLKYKRHSAEGASSAEDALSRLPGSYDLIICDILLEGMNGLALLDRIKRMDIRVPVVMITGYGGYMLEEECRKKGAAGFLKKPFTAHSLLEIIESTAGRREHAR